MKVYKYTYIHILWWDDTKFYKSMIELLHSSDKIDVSQHCFVTPYKKVYESIKEYDNTKLINLDGLPLLLKCSKYAKWIFCHPLNLTFVRCLLIPKNIANKIIWRTWGHDIRSYDDIPKDNNIIWLWKRRLFQLYIRKAKEFKCIGIANAVDKVNVNNVFGHDQKTIILPYGSTKVNILEKIRETETVDENSNNSIKIFVGHNGNAADRHINILKTLSRFSDQNISVIVDLINGSDPEYVKNVKTYAADIFGNKAVFLNDFMPFEDFSRVIYSCKICVLDIVLILLMIRKENRNNKLLMAVFILLLLLSFVRIDIRITSLLSRSSATHISTYDIVQNIEAQKRCAAYWKDDKGYDPAWGRYVVSRAVWAAEKTFAQ